MQGQSVMALPAASEVTRLLAAVADDESGAAEQLLPIVYGELRRLAESRMAAERPGHTLQATALVHEAYLRLVEGEDPEWENRGHFFAAAAEAMRRILIEHARNKSRQKRGGDRQRLGLRDEDTPIDDRADELLALDEALTQLETHDKRMARIVKLRYFAGLSVEQTAAALDIGARTVKRDWATARAWLRLQMGGTGDDTG